MSVTSFNKSQKFNRKKISEISGEIRSKTKIHSYSVLMIQIFQTILLRSMHHIV